MDSQELLKTYPTTLNVRGEIFATDIYATGELDAKRKAARWANGIVDWRAKGHRIPNPHTPWETEKAFYVKRWGGAELSIKWDFFGDPTKHQRIAELKDQVQCPNCKSFKTDVIEALAGRRRGERWFGHHCRACDFSNAFSNDFIIEEPNGKLTTKLAKSNKT